MRIFHLLGISLLCGTIIGVGVFSLPYAFLKFGPLVSIFYLFLVFILVLFSHLFFGEIILRTPQKVRIPGYAEIYLGKKAKKFLLFLNFLNCPLLFSCYLIFGANFLSFLFGKSYFISLIILWFFLNGILILGFRPIAYFELFMLLFFGVLLISFIFISLPKFNSSNLWGFHLENIFFPYGVFLFSLLGTAGIPLVVESLKDEKKEIKKVIFWGTFLPFLFYIIFSLIVIGVCGKETSEESLFSLAQKIGKKGVLLGCLFGILSSTTSYVAIGRYFEELLVFDVKLKKKYALFLVIFLSLAVFLFNKKSFIFLISLIGGIFSSIENIFLVFIFKKARKKGKRHPEFEIKNPSFLPYVLLFSFLLGLLFEIKNLLAKI